MRAKSATTGLRLAALAAKQHGVVDRRQLAAAGLSGSGISRRIQAGQLHRVHRGVYAVGHPGLSPKGRWMAAVLACGEGAVLSHRSAAALLSLLDDRGGAIHVSVPTSAGRRRRPGMRLHRRPSLTVADVTHRHGIPVTTSVRTIADLRGTVPAAQERRAIRQAEVLGLATGLERAAQPTRSELEHLFLLLCDRSGLPAPEVNVRIGPREVDFLWPAERVIVETDGYRYHRGATAFEDDHDRDLDLRARGYDILRFTHRQVTTNPHRITKLIATELATNRS